MRWQDVSNHLRPVAHQADTEQAVRLRAYPTHEPLVNGSQAPVPRGSDGQVIDAPLQQLASSLAGHSVNLPVLDLGHWFQCVLDLETQEYIASALHPSYHADHTINARVLLFVTEVSEEIKQRGPVSLGYMSGKLSEKRVLVEKPWDDMVASSMTACLFLIVGWISNLYKPDKPSAAHALSIDKQDSPRFALSLVDASVSRRPLVEVLRALGDLLPPAPQPDAAFQPTFVRKAFPVASLNVATLKKLGKLEIEWVDTFTLHLDFQPDRGILRIFRYPSFCALFRHGSSVLDRILNEYYQLPNIPDSSLTAALMDEILLSYSLLFRLDSGSQRIYTRHERHRATCGDRTDSVLDSLCQRRGKPLPGLPVAPPIKESFEGASDFPLLSHRLARIQEYIDGVQPNRIASLWQDKRDILRWYTFWAVIIVGGLNLLFALIQAGFGLAQVILTEKGLHTVSN